ncbi:MAG: cobalt-precorrin-5B (C(1))-methyltransferase CbiD [Eggerthellaceae bacterium]
MRAVHKLERYVNVGTKMMRCGYTTGTCAAGAARAAAETLFAGAPVDSVIVETPAGISVELDIEQLERGDGWVRCAVRKDGGDDPDVTDGALVFATVTRSDEPGVRIDGGLGVGRVTRPGLDQPIGAAAINSTPRSMIAAQVEQTARECGYAGGADVEISIPAGVELAKRTFNPRLGIEGGLSVLGTSGIVRPMSAASLIGSLEIEMRQLAAEGEKRLLLAPGNYGRDFARDVLGLSVERCVQCSNYLGEALDRAVTLGFETVLVIGHIGKLVKVAAGNMNTHSRVSDARRETLAAHAALAGASRELVAALMDAGTTDEMLDLLDDAGLVEPVMATVTERIERQLEHRTCGKLTVAAVVFSKTRGELGRTSHATELVERYLHEGGSSEGGTREGGTHGGGPRRAGMHEDNSGEDGLREGNPSEGDPGEGASREPGPSGHGSRAPHSSMA